MREYRQISGRIRRRLSSILDEDVPPGAAGQEQQLKALLDLEEEARSACVELWLLKEIRTARDTTGWVMLIELDEEMKQ